MYILITNVEKPQSGRIVQWVSVGWLRPREHCGCAGWHRSILIKVTIIMNSVLAMPAGR